MPRGENLPRFGEKADQMKRNARRIRERNEQRARDQQRQQADA